MYLFTTKGTAWGLSLSLLGLFLLTPYAHAKQAGRVLDAQKQAQQAALRARVVHELKAGRTDKLTPAQWKQVDAARAKAVGEKEAHKPDVRVLSLKEMSAAKGSGPYRNKYLAGTLPWHRSLRDANLCNGNLFKSFTDMQVSAGRGAGLALQRTYNSQDARPGPFGVGWTHAYDIRMEEENPATNETSESLNVADKTDFFGAKHKYHRYCDGLYSPPPYLFDETSSGYQNFLVSGIPFVLCLSTLLLFGRANAATQKAGAELTTVPRPLIVYAY